MKKKITAILCFLLVALVNTQINSFSIYGEEVLPQTIEYEYIKDEIILPVHMSDGSESYLQQIKNSEDVLLAENKLSYHFDVGDYTIYYTVLNNSDLMETPKTYSIKIIVKDTTAPVINVTDEYLKSYKIGDKITIFSATAFDLHDGETIVTLKIKHDEKEIDLVDSIIAEAGEYVVEYYSTDTFGNEAKKSFVFRVENASSNYLWIWIAVPASVLVLSGVIVAIVLIRKRRKES